MIIATKCEDCAGLCQIPRPRAILKNTLFAVMQLKIFQVGRYVFIMFFQ